MRRSTWAAAAVLALALTGCGEAEDEPLDAGPTAEEQVTDATLAPTPEADDPTSETADSTPTAATSTPSPTPTQTRKPRTRRLYQVTDVVDGDTVKVNYRGSEESIRIIGIDTPETVHPSVPDECWGPAASDAATKLLSGERVHLVVDPSQGRRDAYDRLLAYVEIPSRGDFGAMMIRRGHAIEYTYDTAYARQARYQAAEQAARSANRGLWGKCGGADVPLEQPEPTPEPQPEPEPDAGAGCASGYDSCVPPYPPDVDCGDVDGPITVTGDDPHGLDGEGDGLACE